ncbi:hypothetical protein J437_LFUL016213 [Ladona fulva]|uniref:Uncharacterized protein n=1 Tax=Ladona fulva TaxID=123851 RepID=A0A8K0PA53_LADFU|nr:hypothetical protein J437_LFUL016213 [Ladona fulva]
MSNYDTLWNWKVIYRTRNNPQIAHQTGQTFCRWSKMAALRFPWGSTILFATVILCLSRQPLTEGAKAEESLTLQAEQATHGRPTQQHISNVDHHELHPIKNDYGLRTEPLSDSKRAQRNGVPVESTTTSRRSTVRRIKVGSRVPVTTTSKPSNDDTGDGMLMADAGGKSSGAEDGGNEEKKTLAQQVAEGKYGLIQELLPNTVERPGVISYASNPEVPKDTADNLGGLGQEDIWLAEDHVLVLAGGSFRDKGGGLEHPWPPIDNYVAPRRQVKIPENPRIPPPFPVQLREGEPPRFIGDNAPPFTDNIDYPDFQNQGNYPTGPLQPGPWTSNGSYPSEVPQRPATGVEPGGPYPPTPLRPQAPGQGPPLPPAHYLPYPPPPFPPQNGNFTPPLRPPVPFPPTGNLTEPFDEDDPSFYYPPPYDFYYPNDNSTEIPPGPLVPGIVLPPPPDFFAPLNETSRKEKRPPTTKVPPMTKKIQGIDYKTGGNTRQRYRPTIPPKTKAPTISTPGLSYLPVTTTTVETPTITPKRVRPIHVKQRPAQRPRVVVQEHSNLVTTPQVEVIPATVTPLPFTSEEPEQNIGGKTLDLSKLHHVQEKYPTRNNEPLYYYNGPGVSQIVVTSTPRPIFVEEIYNGPKVGVTSAPPKPPKKQIIYIFTAPDQQDVIANQVSSTELPVSLKDHSKYDSQESPRVQTDSLGYKSELPTPPRLENFHNTGSKGQFYDFLPSPIDPGSSRGFRFPDEAPKAVVTPRPTNYLGDLNSEIQNLRQFAFENGAYNSKPTVYYSPTAANSDGYNRTQEEVNQAFRGQIYVPQVNNFQYRPSAYSSQAHPYRSNSDQGSEEVTIVTPKPVSTYPKPGRQRIPPSRGNGEVSIITVKPSVLYSGPVSAQGNQNHQIENLYLRGNGFKPSAYFLTSSAQGNKQQNPSVSIVTPSPQIYNSDSLNEQSYEENPQEDERIRILQSARYSVRPLTASQNPSTYFSSDGSQVIIGENGGHQNDRYPQIYYSSSTPSPPELQNGIRYIYNDQHTGGFVSSTPSPFYDSTPRAPKYISITPEDAKIPPEGRKKIPRPQYEEYFEANRNPSPLSHSGQINGYDQAIHDSIYIQSTTPPTVQTSTRPRFNSQPKFAPYVQGVQNLQNIASSQPQQPVYITPVQHNNNNHQFYVHNTPAPPIQLSQYEPQVTSPKPSVEDAVYIQTTPAPVQYHYPINQQQNIAVTTSAPNFASIFNLPSTTYSPLPSYLTTKDVSLFDDATKNYFTIFGQKIGNQEKESGQGQRFSPTTPLPPLAQGYDESGRGPLVVTTSRPIEPPEERTVVSLVDDIRVNYRDPLPPINPNSEFIAPVRNQPQPPRPSPSPAPALQNSLRGGGALVSYQLPGVDGQGVGGGSRYYFLTPHSVPSVPQQRPFQQDSRHYNQWQRPIYNNYWRGRRSS